jgi:hypothetical protein
MRIALCQIPVSSAPGINLGRVRDALREAADGGADLAVFPEATLTRFGSDLRAAAEPLDGPFCAGLAEAAKQTGVALVAGVFEPAPDGRVYNTAVVVDRDGTLVASYRKLHLFDAFAQRESDLVAPGNSVVVAALAGVSVGVEICYDIRFPELTRALAVAGASLVTVSAAWQAGLFKEEHWVTLLRARTGPGREADARGDRGGAVHADRPPRRGAGRLGAVGGHCRGRCGYVAHRRGTGDTALARQPPRGRVRPPRPNLMSRRAGGTGQERATWNDAKDWAVAINSIVFTLTCWGMLAAQWIDSAISSAVIGCMPV